MRKLLRSTLSCLLALLLAFPLAVSAAASEALGEDLTKKDTLINEATTLSSNVFWSSAYSDFRTENLITYKPNSSVRPLVTYGGILTGRSTISSAAKALEANGYRVVAGMNGDFYNTSNGLPCGLVISQGNLKSTDAGYYAIGFHADGTAVLGKPVVKVSADLGYAVTDTSGYSTQVVRKLSAVNKARISTGGIYLYTYDFNSHHTTGNTESGVDVICTIESGSLSIGGTLKARIDKIIQTSSSTPIGKNQIVLSANAKSNSYYTGALLKAPVGGTVTLNVSAASGWEGVQNAVGALYCLVQNGKVTSGLPSGASPRTAVGQKSDGTLVFYTIDGRQSGYSIGATMTQVAKRLVELGCVSGLCLDGGGSTMLTVTQPNATAAKTVDKPSGGTERAVSNQLFLVSTNQPTGELHHFYINADNNYVLAGSKVTLSASAVDTHYIPMRDQEYELSASAGEISGNVLTTPKAGGDVTVTATGGGKSGSTVIHAVTNPDSISLKKGSSSVSSLNLAPGNSVSLTASAVYGHRTLKADASAFTWKLSGNVGTVSSSGKITATSPGTGTLTVTGGGKSVSVKITVSKVSLSCVDGFEGGVPSTTGYSYGGTLSSNTDRDYVKYGSKSAKLDYTFSSDSPASVVFNAPYSIGSAYTSLNLWVYGNNSGNTFSLLTSDGSSTSETPITTLNFKGWKLLSVKLPENASSVTGFKITGSSSGSGTIYLDQMTASYQDITDTSAPTVTASLSGKSLSGSAKDAVDGILPKSSISVLLDGKAVSFNYNTSTGKITASLPVSDNNGHRITILARDASGNIGRVSCNLTGSAGAQFTDIGGSWCKNYVNWLKNTGITNGYSDGSFRPGKQITRQEFAAMLYRYLGLSSTGTETLPFADADSISSYAQSAIKTLYSAGIINGTEKGGKLYFNPRSNLTRAQAAAMIGRTQELGFASAGLSFTDSGSIPAYASAYIQTMVAQGVISGYTDGSFRPTTCITRGQMAKILYNLQ